VTRFVRWRRLLAAAAVACGLAVLVTTTSVAGAATPNLVTNPGLEAVVDGKPTCFATYGYGESMTTTALRPASAAHSGRRAVQLTMQHHVSGDAKLLQTQSTACAPAVRAGRTYTASVWYHGTSPAMSLTAFTYSPANGWQYWTELGVALPQTSQWSLASAETPFVPAGVTALSFGISVAADGAVWVDDFSLTLQTRPTPLPENCAGTLAQCTQGEWTVLPFPNHVRAVHTVVLSTGKLLFMAGSGNQEGMSHFETTVWDPRADTWTDIDTPEDVFCSGHVQLPNGNVLILGGNKAYPVPGGHGYEGLKSSYVFDVTTMTYERTNDLNTGHWYPSATELGNGDVFSMGGLDENSNGTVTNELWDDSEQRWLPTYQVPQQWNYFGLYPANILTDTGKVFYSGSHVFGNQGNANGPGAYMIDLQANTLTEVPGLQNPNERDQSAAVLLPPAQDQKVIVMGGGNVDTNVDANRLTDLIDLKVDSPSYTAGPLLPTGLTETGAHGGMQMTDAGVAPETDTQGKMYVSAVVLPDRTVLETGGALHNRADPVYETSSYDPRTNRFTPMAVDPVSRGYHSESVLYEDGTVFSIGSNPGDGSFEMRISLFRPPYLFFSGRPTLARPAQGSWSYGSTIALSGTGAWTSAELVKPAAVTHSSDPNQRLVDLPLTKLGTNRYQVALTANANLAPPGWYMLFVQNAYGPSSARWVHVG
jgi:hypothetical protein